MARAFLSALRGPGGFNKLLVVKRLRPELAAEPEFVRMFLAEARLAARVDHPNVVHTSEVGFDAGECFIAMEFVDGQPLEKVFRRVNSATEAGAAEGDAGPAPGLPIHLSLYILIQVLEALHFAHELKDFDGTPLNVVHRDVSPHNVMVTYEGHVKLLDFGIAKAANSTSETRTGVLKGKCAYMSPEQFGDGDVDRRTDVFAAGAVMWQALAGRKLWKGMSDVQIFGHLASGMVPSPRDVRPDVDPALEAICMKALAPLPEKRYATAEEFRMALEDYVKHHREERGSPRELGKFVSELFCDDRAKMHAAIEASIARVETDRPSVAVNLADYFGSSATPTPEAASGTTQPIPPPKGRRRPRILAIGLVALALAAGTGFMLHAWGKPAAPPAPAARRAQLTVQVSPPQAVVSVDGVALTGSPPSGSFVLDGSVHRVQAEAPGWVTHSEPIVLDQETVALRVSLDQLAVAQRSASGGEANPAPVEPPSRHASARSSQREFGTRRASDSCQFTFVVAGSHPSAHRATHRWPEQQSSD